MGVIIHNEVSTLPYIWWWRKFERRIWETTDHFKGKTWYSHKMTPWHNNCSVTVMTTIAVSEFSLNYVTFTLRRQVLYECGRNNNNLNTHTHVRIIYICSYAKNVDRINCKAKEVRIRNKWKLVFNNTYTYENGKEMQRATGLVLFCRLYV